MCFDRFNETMDYNCEGNIKYFYLQIKFYALPKNNLYETFLKKPFAANRVL